MLFYDLSEENENFLATTFKTTSDQLKSVEGKWKEIYQEREREKVKDWEGFKEKRKI